MMNLKMGFVRGGTLAVSACLVGMTVVGCGSGQTTDASSTSSDAVKISMAYNFDGKEFPKEGNDVQTAIEKYTNTKLSIQALPSKTYTDKLPVMISSGELPNVIAGDTKKSYILSAIQDGSFWDLTPYLKSYPKLSSLNPIVYQNISVNGKLYGLPRERPLARNVFYVRKDWLDNLGLKVPVTLDDFYQLLKAFTLNDPDKNGKNDTFGMSVNAVGSFGVFFGAPNNWDVQNGKFIKDILTPQYMDGLKFEKRLYDEKLINEDFAVIDRPQWEGNFFSGKAGVIWNTSNTGTAYQTQVQNSFPKATLDAFSILEGPSGKRVSAGLGSNGLLMFPKSSVKTEQQLKQILNFFEKLNEQPMANLLAYGIEGKHYQVTDGKAIRNSQANYDDEVAYPYRWTLGIVPPENFAIPGTMNPIDKKADDLTKQNEKYLVNDPSVYLVSSTYVEKGAQLDQMIKDANTQFVMGKIDEAGWKQQINNWRQSGGDQVAKEFEDQYAKLPKK